MSHLLLTGASGFVGRHYLRELPEGTSLTATYQHNLPPPQKGVRWQQVDLTDAAACSDLLTSIRPTTVVHLAAQANAGICERYPDKTELLNVQVPAQLATHARQHRIPFLFASTDLVFSGQQPPYQTTDHPDPVSAYGRQKALAEQAVLKAYPAAIVARLPLMYGHIAGVRCFLNEWSEKFAKGEKVYAFTDEYRTACWATDVIKGMNLLLSNQCNGIWHLGGRERLSRYEFAVRLADHLGHDRQLVVPSQQADVQLGAPRPPDVSLDSTAAFALGYQPGLLEEVLPLL